MEDVLLAATEICKSNRLLRKVEGTAIVVGDIHGDLEALERVIDIWKSEKTKHLILLGDYVDRGLHQIEVMNKIAKTIVEEKQFIPLRGNHEDFRVCSRYGFIEELRNKNIKSEPYIELFAQLPIAAKSSKVFMCHGGLPTDENFDINEINNFKRDYTLKEENLKQMLWNDPIDRQKDSKKEKIPSRRGPGIWEFGEPITDKFFKKYNLELLIRAHIALLDGSKWMQNKKILSLFTSKSGVYKPYSRNIAKIDLDNPGNIEIIDITN